ncbi:MAG: protein kinase [Acidobacteria bacterium]|nr:protein kinase [Acidobacteriota bacterium]
MQQVGRYRITGELGRGAMGVVYRAEDPTIGRTVAIKTIRLTDTASEQEKKFLRDRLFREARAAGMLNHPGIVTIYDIYEENDICYVFMEYVDGPALEKLMMVPEPLNRDLMIKVIEGTAEALDFAHSKGIVHRDIKPGNIMLTSREEVKITDFGVAMFTSQQATSAGLILGTPGYMSPEQISDKPTTGKSDQFSLAVIAYQLLTGERPFAGHSLPSLMFKIVNEDPAPVPRLNPTLGNTVDVVLKTALAKDPSVRYRNCTAFATALKNACAGRKDWQPMRLGGVESLETVAEPQEATPVPPKSVPAKPEPMKAAPSPPAPVAQQTSPAVAKPVPAHLLTQRIEPTATVRVEYKSIAPKKKTPWGAIAAGVAVFLLVGLGAKQLLLNNDGSAKPPATAEPVAAASIDEKKPSAMGPPVPKPETPSSEPAEQQSPTTQTPAAGSGITTPSPGKGVAMRVVTNPPGAKVMFDGQPSQMCTTPCEMPLDNGRHTLAAMLEGHRTQSRILSIPQDREAVIMLERATGTLMVRSTPAGVTIIVDGQERPEKTPAMLTLPTGKHKLEFVKEGLNKQAQEVEIGDGTVNNIDVRWQ